MINKPFQKQHWCLVRFGKSSELKTFSQLPRTLDMEVSMINQSLICSHFNTSFPIFNAIFVLLTLIFYCKFLAEGFWKLISYYSLYVLFITTLLVDTHTTYFQIFVESTSWENIVLNQWKWTSQILIMATKFHQKMWII